MAEFRRFNEFGEGVMFRVSPDAPPDMVDFMSCFFGLAASEIEGLCEPNVIDEYPMYKAVPDDNGGHFERMDDEGDFGA